MSPLSRFFLLAFALCFALTVPIALEVQGLLPFALLPRPAQFLIGLVPVIAAAIAARRDPDRAGFWRDALRFRASAFDYGVALLLPWVVLLLALALTLLLGEPLPELQFGGALAWSFLLWTVLGWGEEAGWRAYALPRMISRMGFFRAATVLGIAWAVWHFPRNFASPYFSWDAASFWYLSVFTVQIVLGNYLLCWMFERTRSAIVCAVFHGSTNLVATVWWSAGMDWRMVVVYALVLGAGVAVARRTRPVAAPAAV